MRALAWHGRGDLRLEDLQAPVPTAGQALLEVARCGLCGTDLAEFLRGPVLIGSARHPLTGYQAPPAVLGHELSGRVIALGPDTDGPPAGTRVTANPAWSCGLCFWCARGDRHLCRVGGGVGLASPGALAEQVLVPVDGLVVLPDNVDDEAGALVEPFAVALHALRRACLEPGETVLVQGFGALGALVTRVALSLGAGAVHVSEPLAGRRSRAVELGAAASWDPGACDPGREVRALTHGVGADVVVDTSGVSALVPAAVAATRRGGRTVLLGVGHGGAEIEVARLVLGERALIGSFAYRDELTDVVSMLAQGQLATDGLVTSVLPLARVAADGFQALATDPGSHLKVMADPRV